MDCNIHLKSGDAITVKNVVEFISQGEGFGFEDLILKPNATYTIVGDNTIKVSGDNILFLETLEEN